MAQSRDNKDERTAHYILTWLASRNTMSKFELPLELYCNYFPLFRVDFESLRHAMSVHGAVDKGNSQ